MDKVFKYGNNIEVVDDVRFDAYKRFREYQYLFLILFRNSYQ